MADLGLGKAKDRQFPDSRSGIEPIAPYVCVIGLFIILANIIIVWHYAKEYKKFVPMMYLLISLFDGLTVLFLLLEYAIIFFILFKQDENSPSWSVWAVLILVSIYGVFLRLSIIANVILCVTRTIKIVQPFFHINNKACFIFMAIYGVFWTAAGVVDVKMIDKNITEGKVDTHLEEGQLGDVVIRNMSETTNEIETSSLKLFDISNFLVSHGIPCITSLICFIILVVTQGKKEAVNEESAARMKHVTGTITMLTLLFLVCIGTSTIYVAISYG